MPIYEFKDPLAMEPISVECDDDAEAWSDAVTMCGQMLKDLDGNLPSPTDWMLRIRQGERNVAIIEVNARRFPPLKSVPLPN